VRLLEERFRERVGAKIENGSFVCVGLWQTYWYEGGDESC